MSASRAGPSRVLVAFVAVYCAAAAAATAASSSADKVVSVQAVEGGSASVPCPEPGESQGHHHNWTWVPDHPECVGDGEDQKRFAKRHALRVAQPCVLQLHRLRLGDAGVFSFEWGEVSLSVRLNVRPDCDAPVVVVSDHSGPVKQSQNITLRCAARGSAGAGDKAVAWWLNGQRDPGRRGVELAVRGAQSRSQGVWACETRGRRAEYCLTFAHSPSSKQWGCGKMSAAMLEAQGPPSPHDAHSFAWSPWLLATLAAIPTTIIVVTLLVWVLVKRRRREMQPDDIRVLHQASRQRTCEDFTFENDSDTESDRYVTPETPKAAPQATANSHTRSCARVV
ncbi:uncharacterized protein LOC116943036 isoform X2 [Petromyzon marinus]|uniref:uncharacterized protein LOC116943036 isoform X2 n=1 Tax=Petromyzon marinus TaxID=7757 RepID=UPI003F6E9827